MTGPGTQRGRFGRPAARRLLLVSGAVAAVLLAGGIAVLSLADKARSPAEPDRSAAPSSVASSFNGAGGLGVIAISDGGQVVALVDTENPAGTNEAVVSGRVETLSGGCVGLVRDGGNVVVVWPAGTTFSKDSTGLDVPLYGAVPYGSQLTTGGGYTRIDEWVFRALVPRDCDATDVAYIAARPDYPARPSLQRLGRAVADICAGQRRICGVAPTGFEPVLPP